jgi:magnesium and cobalt transporter
VPARGEVIAHPNGYEFEITDADPRRVKRLRMVQNGARNGTGRGHTHGTAPREAAE